MRILILGLVLGILLLAGCVGEGTTTSIGANSSLKRMNATLSNASQSNLTSQNPNTQTVATVYFFYLSTCPFCSAQRKDVNPRLKAEFPQMKWEEYEVSGADGRMKWMKMMSAHNETAKAVPVTIVGPDVISGYVPGETETKLRAAIKAEIARVEKK